MTQFYNIWNARITTEITHQTKMPENLDLNKEMQLICLLETNENKLVYKELKGHIRKIPKL